MASAHTDSVNSLVAKYYNSKKCIFLYKDPVKELYFAVHRSFLLTRGINKLIGQFITTNWFKVACDTTHDIKFALAWVDEDTSFTNVEQFVNNEAYEKLFKFNEFTIPKDKLQDAYRKLMNDEQTNRSIPILRRFQSSDYQLNGINARLYH